MTRQSASLYIPKPAVLSSICSVCGADKVDALTCETVQNQSRNRSASTPRSHCQKHLGQGDPA